MRHAPALGLWVQRDNGCAFALGILQVAIEALLLTLVDDCGVVRVVRQRRIEALHRIAVSLDKTVDAVFRYQHVIRGDAGLAGVHGLAEGDTFGGIAQRYVGADNGR